MRNPSNFFSCEVEESPMAAKNSFRLGQPSPSRSSRRSNGPRLSTVRKAPAPTRTESAKADGAWNPEPLSLSSIFSAEKAAPKSEKTPQSGMTSQKIDAPLKGPKLSRLAQKALESRPSGEVTKPKPATSDAKSNRPASGKRQAPQPFVEVSSKRQKVVFSRTATLDDSSKPQLLATTKTNVVSSFGVSVVDARWLEKQESMITSWLNFILAPADSKQTFPDANRM